MTQVIREKASARRVLAVLVGLLVTILALQGLASVKPGGFEAFAATTPAPTPTGPAIQFINPAKPAETSNELSDKPDGSSTDNATYHLVAWTHLAPSGAGVQFKYDPGTATDAQPEVTIGNATQVGPDTWELHWDIPDTIPEAGPQDATTGPAPRASPTTGILRAILFSSAGSEVARDEESVSINNKDRPTGENNFLNEDQAETVEITYPTNGQQMGFYGSPDGTYTGILEVTYSAGTTRIDAYYSVDPPGTEPNFVPCGNEVPGTTTGVDPDTAEDGIRCTLASGDLPRQITAVAAVASDQSQDPGPAAATEEDSSDAHRTTGYDQDPTTVVITPTSDTEDVNKCTDPSFRAVVTDASGQQVAGANVDVHAQGPGDNLHFDDSGNKSSAHQAPDQGGHTKEPGVDCESTSTPPGHIADVQGDHEQLNAPDVKHIESTVAAGTSAATRAQGTDDSGAFRFALLSKDQGATQITAFVDEDFNDRFCTEEASGNASIGWSSGAPAPAGVGAEEATCPRPTPGVTGSPTATATATATATSTVRPTNTATSTGPTTNRTVTMSADKGEMPAGRQVTFTGQILSGDRTCTDNEFVQIRRRILGTTSFRDLFATQTDSQGRFSVTRRARQSADYIAVAPPHDNCREASSGEVTVLVKVLMQILASDKTPNRGEAIRIKSSVRPQHDRTKLILQRKKGNRWVRVATTRMNNRSIGNFRLRANFSSRTFRTMWKSQDAEHESNTSRAITIKTS